MILWLLQEIIGQRQCVDPFGQDNSHRFDVDDRKITEASACYLFEINEILDSLLGSILPHDTNQLGKSQSMSIKSFFKRPPNMVQYS